MKTVQLSSTEKKTVNTNPSLSSYLNSLEFGREATPHSWLYEDEDSNKTLQRWLEQLAKVKDLSQFGETIYQFDYRQVEKFGPMGKIPPMHEAVKTLEPQYATNTLLKDRISVRSELMCERIAAALFGKNALHTKRPKSFERVIDDMRARDTLTTNSGWPLFARRSNREVIRASRQDASTGQAYAYPAISLFRNYYGKLRPVWMFPMSMNLIEGSFTQVIQEAILSGPSAWFVTPWRGFEYVKAEFTRMWDKFGWAVSGDTTAMDANFKWQLTKQVFDVVKHLFQKQYWEELWMCMQHVNDIDVVIGPNQKLVGGHGIASGSGWTQLLETVYQFIIYWFTPELRRGRGMAIGDDLEWFPSKFRVTKEDTANILSTWALPANTSKQQAGAEEGYFLQRLFLRGYMSREDSSVLGGIYPTVRALNSLLNPEKYHNPKQWNSDMFCVRCYMILENCVDHPLFEEFVQFVVQGQKDLIPFAKQAADKINKVQQTAGLVPGLVPTYNQEKRTKPLSQYASIRIAAAE